MMSLFPLRIAVVIGLLAWLAIRITATHPLPDWHQGELVVSVPSTEIDSAFESDLAELFAKHLNVKLRLIKQTPDEAVAALMAGRIHMAAGFRAESNRALRYSRSYQSLDERMVCGDTELKHVADISDENLAIASESAQEATLRVVRNTFEKLHWEPRHKTTATQLLQEVAEGKLDCTVANSEQIATMRNYYPDLNTGFSLNNNSAMSWAVGGEGDDSLLEAANRFFDEVGANKTLRQLIDRHYGHNDRLGAEDTTTFISHARNLLPHYRAWFEEAAEISGIDWRLLAALAYRESRWNPNATSFTNVRGMMMLTEDTADRMGVENRLDAHASILAGARYLQLLKEQLPLRISEQERLWLALAAYNQGMGHLEDARIMAVRTGLNPDVWADVKRVMPLLSREEYFVNAKHGQARGGEAVIHVETVRLYHDMLLRLDEQNELATVRPLNKYSFFGMVKHKLGLIPHH